MSRSPNFDKLDADVVFKSSDDVLFALHKKNLSQYTGGFPAEDTPVGSDAIELPEDSNTLELLFQFVYPSGDVPDLSEIPIQALMNLAYAAEKYIVYIARPVCRMLARYHTKQFHCNNIYRDLTAIDKNNLNLIVRYAAKHSYIDIIDDVAWLMVPQPLNETIVCFTMEFHASWALYREQWMSIQRDVTRLLMKDNHEKDCSACSKSIAYIEKFSNIVLDKLEIDSESRKLCGKHLSTFQVHIKQALQNVQKFSIIHCQQTILH